MQNLTQRTAFVLACALLCAAHGGSAQQAPTIPMDPIAVYLMQDCGTGEADASLPLERVVTLGEAAVGRLVTALRQGPDAELLQKLERQAAEDYKRLADFVSGGGLANLVEAEVAEAARQIQEADYVAARLQSLDIGHREHALHALERIGGPRVRKALQETAAQAEIDPRLRRWVLAALDRLAVP